MRKQRRLRHRTSAYGVWSVSVRSDNGFSNIRFRIGRSASWKTYRP